MEKVEEKVAGPDVARPLLVVGLPWAPDLDLFGGRPCPVSDLAFWSSGVAPPAVRSYLRDEIVARGLRQIDVARHLGISRPQLANILSGRFGASPRIALTLKAIADWTNCEIPDLKTEFNNATEKVALMQ